MTTLLYMLSDQTQTKTNPRRYFYNYFNDLFAKKRKLVKLELDLVDRVRADWQRIMSSTYTDRAQAETSVKSCYRYAGLNAPTVIWVNHPLNVVTILIDRPELTDVSGIILNEIWQSELKIQQSIDPEYTAHIHQNIYPHQTLKTLNGNLSIDRISDQLNELVMSRVNDLYHQVSERTIPSPLQDYRIGDLGYFDYFLQIGLNIPQIKPAIDLAKSGGWCWTFERFAILTPKPSKVKIDRQGNIVSIIYNNVNILTDFPQS